MVDSGKDFFNFVATCRAVHQATYEAFQYSLVWRAERTLLPPQRTSSLMTHHLTIDHQFLSQAVVQDWSLAFALLPSLDSLAVILGSETEVTSRSPYHLLRIRLPLFPNLRHLFLCGVAIRPHTINTACLANLESLTLRCVDDSTFSLIQHAPKLKQLEVWRDFGSAPRPGFVDWFPESLLETLEVLEMRGFSGVGGEPLLAVFESILAVRLPLSARTLRMLG